MNMRRRIVTLVATSLIALAIAPGGVQARASNPAIETPPFDRAFVSHNCWTFGTGDCETDATADRGGKLTGSSMSYASETGDLEELLGEEEVTGTAHGFARGGVKLSVSIPRSGASSVDFVINSHIVSATALSSSGSSRPTAEVYYFVYASVGSSRSCTSCTVSVHHTLVDTSDATLEPTERSDENHELMFTLKSPVGDRLKGSVDVYFWLTHRTRMFPTGSLLPAKGTTQAIGHAVVEMVTATFNP